MSYSLVTYTGNGVTTSFAVPYPFISRDHITAKVDGVTKTISWINDGLIQLSPAPADASSVIISRDTSRTVPLVDFQDAQVLTEADLDMATLQTLYVAQEAFDAADSSSVATQVAADALAAANSAVAAANSAADAAASENNAANSATDAANSAADAAASASIVGSLALWNIQGSNSILPTHRASIDLNVTFNMVADTLVPVANTLATQFILKPLASSPNVPANKTLTFFRLEGTYKLNANSTFTPQSVDLFTDATSDVTGSIYGYKFFKI